LKSLIAVSCMGLLGTYINLNSASTTELMANVGYIFEDTWLLVALVAGIGFGFYIIKKLIALVPKR